MTTPATKLEQSFAGEEGGASASIPSAAIHTHRLLLELHAAFWDMASLRRLSVQPWERDIAYRAHAVGARVREYLRQFSDFTPSGHTVDCEWHCDQFEHECSCGFSAVGEAAADTPREYRGWSISWDYGEYSATGPNYDASWEGPEDGWVDNGQRVFARTLSDLREEIDALLDASPPDEALPELGA